jgi:hypothetical protein
MTDTDASAIASIAGAATSAIAGAIAKGVEKRQKRRTADQIREELDVLEAERLVATVRLRTKLINAATDLLPEALRQAKPHGEGKARRPGSPALLRLIARLAMRDVRIDRKPK